MARLSKNKEGFSQKEVAEILEMEPHTVAFYANQEIIIPDISAPKGRGKTRLYSKHNLVQFQVIKQMKEYGIPLNKIRRYFKEYKKVLFDPHKFIYEKYDGDPEDIDNVNFNSPFDPVFLDSYQIYFKLIRRPDKNTVQISVRKIKDAKSSRVGIRGDFTSALIINVTESYNKVSNL